jgi:hypothetical protein
VHVLRNLRRGRAARRLPDCGGGFVPRPIRPAIEWRPGLSLALRPASTARVHASCARPDIEALSQRLRDVPPWRR